MNPNFSVLDVAEGIGWSRYNSFQAGLVRRFTTGLQAQISYTFSRCIDIESGSWALDGGTIFEDSYDHNRDKGLCSFHIGHNLVANGLYVLPFHGNRFIEGWQVAPIFNYHTGLPFNITDGFISAFQNGSTNPANRPNYSPNGTALVNGVTISCNNNPIYSDPAHNDVTRAWHLSASNIYNINPACFSLPPTGELGNLRHFCSKRPSARKSRIAAG